MLEKKTSYDQQITEDGVINVRKITRVFEDGKELTDLKSYHRHTITPLDNVDSEETRTKLIAGVLYTAEFVKAYKKKIKEQEAGNKLK